MANPPATTAPHTDGPLEDWNVSSLDALTRYIVGRHHTYLRRELPLMEEGIAGIVEARSRTDANTSTPLARIFRYFRRELELHLRKEEEVLFPMIRRLEAAYTAGDKLPRFPFGPLANPIGIMEEDHAAERLQLEKMLVLTGNFCGPPDAVCLYRSLFEGIRKLEADMRRHVCLEDEILFRRVGDMESGQ